MKENKILIYDELLRQKNIYDGIFNRETLEYLDALLNLEISVLKKDDTDIIKDITLVDLKLYRDIVAYNIYENSKRIISLDESYYKVDDASNLFICTKNDRNLQSVLYNFNYNNNQSKYTIKLYGDNVTSVEERLEALKSSIEMKNEEINVGAEESSSYSDYIKSHEYFRLACQLKELKNKTCDDLTREYESDLVVAKERKKVLDYFLESNELEIEKHFVTENNELVASCPHTKIIIKNYSK